MAEATSLGNLQSLISLFTGGSDKKSTTVSGGGTSTQTTQTQLTTEEVQKLIQSALESNQGLASVVSGQQGSGLYNSTVNTQLVNDLMSRTATQVAATAAPKVTTTTTPQVVQTTTAQGQKGLGAGGLLGLLGLSAVKNQIDPFLSGKKSITDIFSGGDSTIGDTGGASQLFAEAGMDWSGAKDIISGSSSSDTIDMFGDNAASLDLSSTVQDVASPIIDAGSDAIGELIGNAGDWMTGISDSVDINFDDFKLDDIW